MSDGTDVLRAIDQLRHDLSGYHGQLKAHNDLQRHCDNQRERIAELEGLYANAKAERDEAAMSFSKERDRAEFLMRENAKLRELVQDIYEVMWACAEQRCTHRHDGCFRVRGNHGDICVSERCWYEDRMSELGIEV